MDNLPSIILPFKSYNRGPVASDKLLETTKLRTTYCDKNRISKIEFWGTSDRLTTVSCKLYRVKTNRYN